MSTSFQFWGIEICMARQKYIYIKCVCLHSRWIINYLKQKYVPFFDLWNMGMWYLDLNINDTHVHVCIWLYDFDHMF